MNNIWLQSIAPFLTLGAVTILGWSVFSFTRNQIKLNEYMRDYLLEQRRFICDLQNRVRQLEKDSNK